MKLTRDASQERKLLLSESEELRAQARELICTSNELMEQLRANMRKLEKFLKQKDKH